MKLVFVPALELLHLININEWTWPIILKLVCYLYTTFNENLKIHLSCKTDGL